MISVPVECYLLTFVERSYILLTREPRNKSRLKAQHLSCLHLFRHLAPNLFDNRQIISTHLVQPDCAIQALDLSNLTNSTGIEMKSDEAAQILGNSSPCLYVDDSNHRLYAQITGG